MASSNHHLICTSNSYFYAWLCSSCPMRAGFINRLSPDGFLFRTPYLYSSSPSVKPHLPTLHICPISRINPRSLTSQATSRSSMYSHDPHLQSQDLHCSQSQLQISSAQDHHSFSPSAISHMPRDLITADSQNAHAHIHRCQLVEITMLRCYISIPRCYAVMLPLNTMHLQLIFLLSINAKRPRACAHSLD